MTITVEEAKKLDGKHPYRQLGGYALGGISLQRSCHDLAGHPGSVLLRRTCIAKTPANGVMCDDIASGGHEQAGYPLMAVGIEWPGQTWAC
jgi:hypothetical protein